MLAKKLKTLEDVTLNQLLVDTNGACDMGGAAAVAALLSEQIEVKLEQPVDCSAGVVSEMKHGIVEFRFQKGFVPPRG